MATVDNDINQPWTENYKPLHEWLQKHEAHCNWQKPLGDSRNPSAYVEQWLMRGGRLVIVVVYAKQHGWELYTPGQSEKIDETLEDAEKRLGLIVEPKAPRVDAEGVCDECEKMPEGKDGRANFCAWHRTHTTVPTVAA